MYLSPKSNVGLDELDVEVKSDMWWTWIDLSSARGSRIIVSLDSPEPFESCLGKQEDDEL